MKPLLMLVALGLSQPAPAQDGAAVQREVGYAQVVGHVEAAAQLCMAPTETYRAHVLAARALLPEVFKRAKLAPEAIEPSIAAGRQQVPGWMPALDCMDFNKVVTNLANWTAAADGWPPAR